MLKRIQIRGFKSLFDVEVELAPLVVLLGPNAAGKSNFQESLSLLSRLVTEKTLADAFEPPLRGYPAEAFSLPDDGLQGLLSRESAELSIEADLDLQGGPGGLRYRIGVRIDPQTGALATSDEFLGRVTKDGSLNKGVAARIQRDGDHLLIRRIGGRPAHLSLGLNHTSASNLQLSGDPYRDFDLLRAELERWNTYYLDPRVAMREPQPPREVSDIGARGHLIAPLLHRLKETKELHARFVAVRRALHSAIPSIESLDVDLDRRRGTLDIQITQDGTPYSSRVISEGTLRILALCAIAANPTPSSLVSFEEPENGVHPRRIEVIANLLLSMVEARRTQVVVTTHSPTFVGTMLRKSREHPGLIRLLRCTQEGRETRIARFDPAGPLFDDSETREALRGPEDDALIEGLMLRGWLDGG